MNSWDMAMVELDKMAFPSDKFFDYLKKGDGKYEFFGISKNSKRHIEGKNVHSGERTKISGLLDINGFGTEFVRDYCFSCKKVIKLQGVIFNNDENVCYVRVFLESKNAETFEELDGGLGF